MASSPGKATDTPPWPVNRHAERVVLGNALQDWPTLKVQIGPDLFWDQSHQRILRVMLELDKRGEPVDSTTVCEQLKRNGLNEGDISVLIQLGDVPVLGSGLDPYIRTLDKTRRLRTLAIGGQEIATEACIEGTDLRHLHDRYEKLGTVFRSDEAPRCTIPAWPSPLGEDAYHGVTGELVRLIEPHTEGDSAALLVQFLAAWGSMAGRGAYYLVEGDYHHTNIYAVIVGATSKGRKGTSWGRVRAVLAASDEHFADNCIIRGLGSGEGLIDALSGENADKRCLIQEAEFARILAVASREGTTLSSILREAYDSESLSLIRARVAGASRPNKVSVKGAHVSMIAHITRDELRRRLGDVELANGFANRILWVCAARSKELPEGGGSPDIGPLIRRIASATHFTRRLGSTRVRMDSAARELWMDVYHDLSAARPGLLGQVTNRLEANTIRVSLNYALLDESEEICEVHLRAGLAVVSKYCFDSARFIWGDALGDPVADQTLKRIRDAGAGGLTRLDLMNAFSRHKSSTELDRAIGVLTERALIRAVSRDDTGGRRETQYFAL
jgi:hypothetical protein